MHRGVGGYAHAVCLCFHRALRTRAVCFPTCWNAQSVRLCTLLTKIREKNNTHPQKKNSSVQIAPENSGFAYLICAWHREGTCSRSCATCMTLSEAAASSLSLRSTLCSDSATAYAHRVSTNYARAVPPAPKRYRARSTGCTTRCAHTRYRLRPCCTTGCAHTCSVRVRITCRSFSSLSPPSFFSLSKSCLACSSCPINSWYKTPVQNVSTSRPCAVPALALSYKRPPS